MIAVQAAEPLLEWTPADSPANWRRYVERHVEEWTAPLASAGVAVETVVEEEMHPADGLLGAVGDHDGDLLVVGARGSGGFVGLRAGGVAMKVLHRAGVPIVLIPES